ncbi:2OG-Fe dioxygenase family protein [Lichenicoccus sp.]|uniref:2OG-Fe dioxygenase family protein n=1 Tax=Lichenicoccus sp. TaxID=2781899 RepID=UPI003D0E73A9
MSDQPLAFTKGGLAKDGFALLRAPQMRAALLRHCMPDEPAAWRDFAESWNDLGLDRYMADGGRYRRRRHATFSVRQGHIARKPHQPHYQSRDYNLLNGGVERWFAPVTDPIGNHLVLRAILATCEGIFTPLTPPALRPADWHVELHQFRIEAHDGEQGQPTPEGLHRDGVDWVLVLLVARENVESGVTSIHDLQRRLLGSFTLSEPLDTALVDDGRVYHGVTAIRPLHAGREAYRDVLVATFRR